MSDRAVGYVRVSTEEQAREGVSLEQQEAKIRAYCGLQGLELARIHRDEGVSAAKPLAERPAGAELLHDLATHQRIRHVVALKLDRLFRDAVDCLRTSSAWDRTGVALHLIDLGGQAVNTGSAMGRFFLTVMAGAAELERNLIRERTTAALAHKKARGDRLGGTPIGFRMHGGELAVDPAELAAVRLIFELRRGPRPISFRAICERLTEAGHSPKRGGSWHAETVRKIWASRERYLLLLDAA